MSKKKSKHKEHDPPVLKQEIPIQDDPYWKVSSLFLDYHRVGRFMRKFEQFNEEYPEWTGMLMEGLPTYYCVLGVPRGTSKEDIEKAYMKKLRFSYFSRDIIEEAYDVLSNEFLEKEYYELILVFEQITKCMMPSEKKELIETHTENIKNEKDFVKMGEIQPQYAQFLNIYLLGAPGLYEIIGLDPESSFENIKKRCETGSELFKKIYTILGDPSRRDDYNFLMYFVRRFESNENHEQRNMKVKKWEKIERKTFEKIMINSLSQSEGNENIGKRLENIISANQDWMLYLPPNKDTFFSILGIDKSSLSGDKKEIEKILREKYRYFEKTPKVNLAYSVLKNESQRIDYLWISENIDIFNAMEKIASDEEENVPLKKGKGNKKKKQGGKKKKQPSQVTFEELDRMMEKIFEMAKRENMEGRY
ncbi:MAG: hypothetical protein OIN90_01315 [Candidatus Methanoperedens sp.]|nr:hypothetical protein [Candidatus Methanoperedens sp.]